MNDDKINETIRAIKADTIKNISIRRLYLLRHERTEFAFLLIDLFKLEAPLFIDLNIGYEF